MGGRRRPVRRILGGSDSIDEPEPDAGPTEPGDVMPEPTGDEDIEPVGEEVTSVLPAVGDDLTELLPPTGTEPTEVLPPTGTEPTEVLVAGAVAADGTGEFTREHRRRVSHRRYVMRRIGVAVATLAIVGGGIALLVALLGDDDEGAGGTDSTDAGHQRGRWSP